MVDLRNLLSSWYMVGWLLGAGVLLRCGAWIFDGLNASITWLFQKKP